MSERSDILLAKCCFVLQRIENVISAGERMAEFRRIYKHKKKLNISSAES